MTLPAILSKVLLDQSRTSHGKPHMNLLDKNQPKSHQEQLPASIAKEEGHEQRHLAPGLITLLSRVPPDSVCLCLDTPKDHWLLQTPCLMAPSSFLSSPISRIYQFKSLPSSVASHHLAWVTTAHCLLLLSPKKDTNSPLEPRPTPPV